MASEPPVKRKRTSVSFAEAKDAPGIEKKAAVQVERAAAGNKEEGKEKEKAIEVVDVPLPFPDMVLIVGNVHYRCHRSVLARGSAVFTSLCEGLSAPQVPLESVALLQPLAGGRMGESDVHLVGDTFRDYMSLIYEQDLTMKLQEVKQNIANVLRLLIFADYVDHQVLLHRLESLLIDFVNRTNKPFTSIYGWARDLKLPKLVRACEERLFRFLFVFGDGIGDGHHSSGLTMLDSLSPVPKNLFRSAVEWVRLHHREMPFL